MIPPYHKHESVHSAKILTLIALLVCAAPVFGQASSLFEKKTYRYTGGEYHDEVFGYRLMKPAHIEPGKKYPLVLLLHGAGERGTDNDRQLKYFGTWMARPDMREKYPCFVVAPQCRPRKQWVNVPWGDEKSSPMPDQPSDQMNVAIAVLLTTIHEEPIDTSRVYLTGLSMGGYGTWDLAMRHPDWFAAVAPVCGGGDEHLAKRLAGVPLWAFHGDADRTVPTIRSRMMIEAIRSADGDPKYTECKGVGHNVWTRAYDKRSGLADWMFAQQKIAPVQFPPAPPQSPAP